MMGTMRSMRAALAGAAVTLAITAQLAAAQAPGAAYAEFVMASYDVDGDGEISRLEFSATGRGNFDAIDQNLDGVASAEEIAAWYMNYISG